MTRPLAIVAMIVLGWLLVGAFFVLSANLLNVLIRTLWRWGLLDLSWIKGVL